MLEQMFLEFYAECQQGMHDFVDRKTKHQVTFKDMLCEPLTKWEDPFISKVDEGDEELTRIHNQMVHVGELKRDPHDATKMIISTEVPKGLPQPRTRKEGKREIRSTLQTKYKDYFTEREL